MTVYYSHIAASNAVSNAVSWMLILLLLHHSGHLQLQKPLLQLLVNMAASSSICLQHIWDQCFPGRFAALAKTLSGTHGCNLCHHCY